MFLFIDINNTYCPDQIISIFDDISYDVFKSFIEPFRILVKHPPINIFFNAAHNAALVLMLPCLYSTIDWLLDVCHATISIIVLFQIVYMLFIA